MTAAQRDRDRTAGDTAEQVAAAVADELADGVAVVLLGRDRRGVGCLRRRRGRPFARCVVEP